MRIGIDARELRGRPTGVGRYLSHLLQSWANLDEASAHTFVLYSPEKGLPPSPSAAFGLGGLRVETREIPGATGTWWEQVRLASALAHDAPDVLFAPAYSAPIATRTPVVLTIHDVSFLAHPEWFPPRSRIRRRVVTTLAARRARRVVTVSRFSKGEIVSRLGVPEDRVVVVPEGVTRLPSVVSAGEDRREPIVLFVGSIFNRRHLPELIRAVAVVAARNRDVRLEVVGDDRTFPRQDLAATIEAAGLAGRATMRSYVPDEVLADLYDRAGVFAFLSDYEGFGLTPLEALAAGIPVVVGDTPVAREVLEDAASFVSTTDVAAIASALERLLFDGAARKSALRRAPAVLGRYSWARAGRQTLEVLLGACRPGRRTG